MSDWPDVPTPEEIKALEATLDAIFKDVEGGKDHIEAEECWPGFMMPTFNRIEEHAILAESATIDVKFMTHRLIALVTELSKQRDDAIAANVQGVPLLDQLPAQEVDIVKWLISTLNSQQGEQRAYWVRVLIEGIKATKKKIERGVLGE